jgi:ribosomal protein S18 acetylase RimI-like enzyme
MLIRKATPLDLPAVAALHCAIADEIRAMVPGGFGTPEQDSTSGATGRFRDMLDDPDYTVLLAEENGRIVALGSGFREDNGDTVLEGPFMTIEFVEVDPAYRGRGIGSQLVAALENDARSRGLERIDLIVLRNNEPACKLYDKLGYDTLEFRKGKVLS